MSLLLDVSVQYPHVYHPQQQAWRVTPEKQDTTRDHSRPFHTCLDKSWHLQLAMWRSFNQFGRIWTQLSTKHWLPVGVDDCWLSPGIPESTNKGIIWIEIWRVWFTVICCTLLRTETTDPKVIKALSWMTLLCASGSTFKAQRCDRNFLWIDVLDTAMLSVASYFSRVFSMTNA